MSLGVWIGPRIRADDLIVAAGRIESKHLVSDSAGVLIELFLFSDSTEPMATASLWWKRKMVGQRCSLLAVWD